jgi:hypothetical protein
VKRVQTQAKKRRREYMCIVIVITPAINNGADADFDAGPVNRLEKFLVKKPSLGGENSSRAYIFTAKPWLLSSIKPLELSLSC